MNRVFISDPPHLTAVTSQLRCLQQVLQPGPWFQHLHLLHLPPNFTCWSSTPTLLYDLPALKSRLLLVLQLRAQPTWRKHGVCCAPTLRISCCSIYPAEAVMDMS